MKKIMLKIASSLLLGFSLITPLIAQDNRDLPIDITANEVLFEQSKNLVIYEDNVVMTQGTLEIKANRAEFIIDDNEAHDITAFGNVRIKYQPPNKEDWIYATAAKLQYLPAQELILLTGKAVVTQEDDTMSADRIEYHLDSAQIRALSNKGQNIHFRIHPKRKEK